MAPKEPNCQHADSPVRWRPSRRDPPVVPSRWGNPRRRPFAPDLPRIGPWKAILGEWCNGSTTGSEPVSLGSNPSSPVFISHAPRGFRHSGADLPRERGAALRPTPSLGERRPSLTRRGAFGTRVPTCRGSEARLYAQPRRSGNVGLLSRAEGLSALGCRTAAGAGRGFGTTPSLGGLSAGSQCQRRSQPRRQKNHISPPVVASIIAIATSAP